MSGDGTKFAGTIVKLRCEVIQTRAGESLHQTHVGAGRPRPGGGRAALLGDTGGLDGPPFFCHQREGR